MTILNWLFPPRTAPKTGGSSAAQHAIKASDDLIQQMQERSRSNDPARALLADIWAQRNNVPYMVTVYESSQEVLSAIEQKSGDADDAGGS